jgi:hypothetical protein
MEWPLKESYQSHYIRFYIIKVISRSWPFKYRSRPGAANKPKNTGKPMIRKNKNTGKNQINI